MDMTICICVKQYGIYRNGLIYFAFISAKTADPTMDQIIEPTIDDIIKALPLKQKVPVAALKKLLDEREAIDQQQQAKTTETRLKYQKLIQPLLQRASEIIRGGAIKPQEIANGQACMKPGEKASDYLKGKVIEDYWISVLSNSALVDEINEKDEKALKYLLDIQKIYDPADDESIELKFVFKENPFFKETTIQRKLDIKNGEVLALEGDLLTWKENQCLTHALKKVTNKKNGEKKSVQGEKIKSFFDIFLNCDKKNPEMLNRVATNMSEISSLLILDSVDYFLGVINADEQSEDDADEDEDDAEDENQN